MKKYRITFMKNDKSHAKKDVSCENSEEAFRLGYKMPEAKYSDEIGVEEIPEGPSPIGIEFSYRDTCIKRDFIGYVIIFASDESHAVEYFNKNLIGKRFWFSPGKLEKDGKCVIGKALDTYFAACPGFDFDATKQEK